MMWLQCKECDPKGCDFKAMGATQEEVMKGMMEHMQGTHADMVSAMSEDDKKMMMDKCMPMIHAA